MDKKWNIVIAAEHIDTDKKDKSWFVKLYIDPLQLHTRG